LREGGSNDYIVGMSSKPTDLLLAQVYERHCVPYATDPRYSGALQDLILHTHPDFLHVQHDFEVRAVSRLRDWLENHGVRLYLPAPETVENCVNKEASYRIWKSTGLKVPETILLQDEADLRRSFARFGGKVWIRATEGDDGFGALPTESFQFALAWIEHFEGWGKFTAAERLTDTSVTWQSIWHDCELVVGQGRLRRSWAFANRTISGVTGITEVGETVSDEAVDRIAQDAILAIDARPHGVFSVDMTYDHDGAPNPTEINIGRFFTTIYFFTKAGLNMPQIYRDIALERKFPSLKRRINPLPAGLLWIRGMDVEPVLAPKEAVEGLERWDSRA
jgi:carbamoyl-phosphate synthase large subunit